MRTQRQAAAFFKQLNFTSVHMLSPHDPILLALARLPIAVPFHSIIGQKHNGSRKRRRGSLCELASRRCKLRADRPKRTQRF